MAKSKENNSLKTIVVSLILAVVAGALGVKTTNTSLSKVLKTSNKSVSVKTVKFAKTKYTIEVDESKNIEVIISPKTATNKNITCKSANKNIVTVKTSNNTCIITGIKKGTAKVYVYSKNGNKKGTANITVNSKTAKKVNVTGIKFSQGSYTIAVDEARNIEVTISPSTATNKGITCKSSDPKIATARASNNTCMVKGIKEGKVTLEVTSKDGNKKTTATINVNKKDAKTHSLSSIKFAKTSYTIEKNELKNIEVIFTPNNATNKEITCKSQDNKIVATSNQNNTCIIKGVGAGTTTIEAYSKDENKKATTKVTVEAKTNIPNQTHVSSIKFSQTSYTIEKGKTKNLEVVIAPSNATNKSITCRASDLKIVSVKAENNTCVVKGLKKGSTTVEVVSLDNEKSGTAKITIK